MKLLREYIRELLTEAAKKPVDLPDNIFVRVITDGVSTEFAFVKKRGEYNGKPTYSKTSRSADGIYGLIELESVDEYKVGPCRGAFMITWSQASPGYGPMLYDLAMEWATENGGGLIADRSLVSDEAERVWNYYLSSRSDVKIVQLDDPNNELTDIEEDNCDQEVAGGQNYMYPKNPDRIDPNWPDSPLSKAYRKPGSSMTRELTALGKLV